MDIVLTCKRCGELKDESCFSSRKDRKRGFAYYCKPCFVLFNSESVERHRVAHLARRKVRYAANADELRAKALARYEGRREEANAAHAQWMKDNKPRAYAHVRQRKQHIRRATPPWANKKRITDIYEQATALTQQTGVEYHVDHIVPLRGRNVCGLHVENNLQILLKEENLRKHNKWT